jgi:NAD-dependent dihydropyrimidine dehydrogenase PreA subunit/predicted transcriptional regulator
MAKQNDAYQTIAEMWTFPESDSFRKMLECLMTQNEASLLLECREPITIPELAQKLKTEEKVLADKFDNFAKRGLIYRGQTQYHFRRGVHFSFAGGPASPEYAAAKDYDKWRKIWQDENPNREVKGWLESYRKTGNPIHRVYPDRLAVLSNPNIKKEQLLWHEDIEQIFQRAEIIISGPCGCRTRGGMGRRIEGEIKNNVCDHPLWNCFQFRKETLDFARGRGTEMRVYSVAEAIAKSDEAERAGLIHEGPGNAAVMPGIICSCADDCCGMLIQSQNSGENMHELYIPSRFQATVEQDKCTGCQECIGRCSFESISMVKVSGSKKMKAQIKAADCYGCGSCVVDCEQKAIRFDLIRPPEHVPPADASRRRQPTPLK